MTVTEDRPTNQQTQAAGRVVRVTGPVVDVEFPRDAMPDLFNALKVDVTLADLGKTLTLEVAQHLGKGVVRTISMAPTDGLVRGAEVTDTGSAISVPVGFSDRGLPMGMQIVGRNRGELAVLQLAHAYDEATGWVQRKPPPLA